MKILIFVFSSVLLCKYIFAETNVDFEIPENANVIQKRFKLRCNLVEELEEDEALSDTRSRAAAAVIEKQFRMECKLVGISNETKQCAPGWIQFQNSCYLFWRNTTLSFQDASTICGRYGAHLVFVETAAENTFIKQKLGKFPSAWWWMGIDDINTEGTWKYHGTDKVQVSFTDWATGQPDNGGGNEDCVHFWFRDTHDIPWNDRSCTDTFLAVCEKEIN